MCRRRFAQAELRRIRADETGELRLDARQGVGRSAYLCSDPECRARICKKGLLERSLRVPISAESRASLAREIGLVHG